VLSNTEESKCEERSKVRPTGERKQPQLAISKSRNSHANFHANVKTEGALQGSFTSQGSLRNSFKKSAKKKGSDSKKKAPIHDVQF